jgi:hypothetical protein
MAHLRARRAAARNRLGGREILVFVFFPGFVRLIRSLAAEREAKKELLMNCSIKIPALHLVLNGQRLCGWYKKCSLMASKHLSRHQ